MSSVDARPLGSDKPPDEIFIQSPVFRYGLKKALLPAWPGARLRVESAGAGGPPAADVAITDGRLESGFLVFEVHALEPGARYDAHVVADDDRFTLFSGAELFRLAIDDPGYRALPVEAPPRP